MCLILLLVLESPTRSQGKKTTRKGVLLRNLIPLRSVLGAVRPEQEEGSLTTVTTVQGLLCSATRAPVNCLHGDESLCDTVFVSVTGDLLFKAPCFLLPPLLCTIDPADRDYSKQYTYLTTID